MVRKTQKNIQDVWVASRQQDRFYITNKVFSFMLSASLAGVTLSYKPLCHEYQEYYDEKGEEDYTYTIIYWFLFIFYSFQALDELIEMFSVLTKREKGALGLLFEMNYIMGLVLSVFLVVFVFTAAELEERFKPLYNWLFYQVVIFFVAIGAILAISTCFAVIQRRTLRQQKASQIA
ncbi:UNKNOWN [Stylonychia lemnae]|uniref:Uncharacterized protein n=1 Tax=Stylonychia lemnae TaxID=5949 RepID=A0A077ZZL1_STYLE|nr:UNKNOWN [Stylonychia lemnae]|eukprot:CDW73963.1 UNKNOWN [Stylonychia lemnae]